MTPWQLAKESEHSNQIALFAWANWARQFGYIVAADPARYTLETVGKCLSDPRLEWLHAIPNQGHGDAIRGAKFKAEGVKAGVADIFLPVPILVMNEWVHGLYIELKRDKSDRGAKGRASTKQKEFEEYCLIYGYQYRLATGWIEAANAIELYLTGSKWVK